MTVSTLPFAELKGVSLEELLRQVLREQALLKIRLDDGQVVVIQPEPNLQPLPLLEGSIPNNWKDEIYG